MHGLGFTLYALRVTLGVLGFGSALGTGKQNLEELLILEPWILSLLRFRGPDQAQVPESEAPSPPVGPSVARARHR